MKQLLEFQATLYEPLFVSATHNQLKLLAISLDTIGPVVFTHKLASALIQY